MSKKRKLLNKCVNRIPLDIHSSLKIGRLRSIIKGLSKNAFIMYDPLFNEDDGDLESIDIHFYEQVMETNQEMMDRLAAKQRSNDLSKDFRRSKYEELKLEFENEK